MVNAIITPFLVTPKSLGAKPVPGVLLPRSSKKDLELLVGKTFLDGLNRMHPDKATDIRNFEDDPPDLKFKYDNQTIHLELCEIVPVNRLQKDDFLNKLQLEILDNIGIGEHTRNRRIIISFSDDFSKVIPFKKEREALAKLIDSALITYKNEEFTWVTLPGSLSCIISSIKIESINTIEAEQLFLGDIPQIIFPASATYIKLAEEFSDIFKKSIAPKLLHDIGYHPSLLLLWSENDAMLGVHEDFVNHVREYIEENKCPYDGLYFLSIGPFNKISLIYQQETKNA